MRGREVLQAVRQEGRVDNMNPVVSDDSFNAAMYLIEIEKLMLRTCNSETNLHFLGGQDDK